MTLKSAKPVLQPNIIPAAAACLKGKRVAMVMYSTYPTDPRPRRAAETLLKQGMSVDLVCLQNDNAPKREGHGDFDIVRVPLTHKRGGKLSYAFRYSSFIVVAASIMAFRSIKRRYDLVYVHNMPDVLVASALVPKMFGAKVILDQHDPMPELMMTIFGLGENSLAVRVLRWLEKWSIARADLVITVNLACKRIFGSRSCSPEKIGVVMNSPDEVIFPFHPVSTSFDAPINAKKRFVLMYHGSLVERNGLDLAVDALEHLQERVPDVELRIFGQKTPFLSKVLETVRQKGLSQCVSYGGPRSLEGLVHEIQACDVGLIPNHRSAFAEINTPTRIFEYLALGKPVIAPRAAGISAYFAEDAMVFFELGSATDLADKIERVICSPVEISGIVRRGQQAYREHRWEVERQQLIALVGNLFSGCLSHAVSTAQIQKAAQEAAGRSSS
jgi:glycosyltransferase involved in cell wall biosynthesis